MTIIEAEIKDVKHYKATFAPKELPKFQLEDILSGIALKQSSFLLELHSNTYAISRWTGPKRTRTWPYQHVYDIINRKPRVAIIPYYKDEGKDGNGDYLQWDTISLMSLLGVYVIFGYYVKARKNERYPDRNKITGHEFDPVYIAKRLEELAYYHSDPIHWNMKEINDYLLEVIEKAIEGHRAIAAATGVRLHSENGLQRRKNNIANFQTQSRALALLAQNREALTRQRRERTGEGLKGRINITNFYKGAYYLTVDEAVKLGEDVFLIEKKHGDGFMPSISDIKDGLLKLILFTNLASIKIEGRTYKHHTVLGLTSDRVKGYCHSKQTPTKVLEFLSAIGLPKDTTSLLDLFTEANANGFAVYLVNADEEINLREKILREFIS